MSTDKLQAIHDTVAEILSDPPSSPHSYFDDEPHEAEQASTPTAADYLQRATEIPKGSFEKVTPGEPGISPIGMREEHLASAGESSSPAMARQALAEKVRATPQREVARQPLFRPSNNAARHPTDPQTSSNTFRSAASGDPGSLRGWALRGFSGILVAGCVGVAAFIWLGSSGDAAKTVASHAVVPGPSAAISPDMTPLLQSISRDLGSARKEIEQLKTARELMVRDNASLSERLQASQDQLARAVARLSDQLKASQDLAARDNANAAEQMKRMQDQLTRLEQTPPKITATTPPRPASPATRKPAPTVSSAQAATQPTTGKPKPVSPPQSLTPAR